MALQAGKEPIILKFGGGLNERTEATKVHSLECVAGKNFDLDFQSGLFKRRRGLAQVASVPNALGVVGGAQLINADDTRSVLFQAGNTIYEWDGTSGSGGMTAVTTVNGAARLRGEIEANSIKDSQVLIADLALQETVKTWNGTTLAALSHGLSGDLKARYIVVENERAFLANIESNNTATPHLLVASKRDDFTTLSTANRPASGLGAGDAFFLPAPDLRPINGLVAAFGQVVFTTRRGAIYQLSGADSTDYALDLLVANAGATGEQALAILGNRLIYGAQGRIDTVSDTDRFGNVQTDDLTRWLAVDSVPDWTMVFSPRWGRLYAVPDNGGRVYVLHKSFVDGGIPFSPWSVWETADGFNFEPTMVMRLFNPTDGLEYVYMGDKSGNIYQTEANTGADPNTTNVTAERTSAVIELPPAQVYDVQGWVRYAKTYGGTLTLTFEWGGDSVFDESFTVPLDEADNAPVFGGSYYFGGSFYFGVSFGGRLTRSKFSSAGRSSQVQIKASVAGTGDFAIEEIGIQIGAAA